MHEVLKNVLAKQNHEPDDYYLDYDNWTEEWWEEPEIEDSRECHACFGTGMDKYEDADCMVCFGDGVI